METETTLKAPVLYGEELSKKVKEFAMEGALKSIKEYYTGYNSPFMKSINEELSKMKIGTGIELPDIIALINDSLTKEIDIIANTAVSKSFIPLVQRFLTREEKEMKFSDILKSFIYELDIKEMDDCSVEIKEETKYDWLNITLYHNDDSYEICFHSDWESKKQGIKKYQILSLPYDSKNNYKKTMKLNVGDNVSLELPFTEKVLQDKFISFVARLVIANTKITMDCSDFDEDMFPKEECHC
ncbi:MAG TPA: hypothetical protein PKN63_12125 [Chitinophagales bacterium]|nr:hypothetical protein [Chitinophagales bacterium]